MAPLPATAADTLADVVIEGVTKRFPASGSDGVLALSEINTRFATGEFVSIVGPSGCGKTTLLRILCGLTEPSSGSVSVAGHPPGSPDLVLGVAFQRPVLLPWRSVLDNILLPAEVAGVVSAELTARARELIEEVGLAGFERSRPHELSTGMQQRVAICRALVTDPAFLVMDEPFAALDALTREQMSLLLHRLWLNNRTTTLFVTHSIPEAVFLSTSVLVMTPRPGRVAARLTVELSTERDLSTLASPEFNALTERVRQAIYPSDGGEDAGTYRD